VTASARGLASGRRPLAPWLSQSMVSEPRFGARARGGDGQAALGQPSYNAGYAGLARGASASASGPGWLDPFHRVWERVGLARMASPATSRTIPMRQVASSALTATGRARGAGVYRGGACVPVRRGQPIRQASHPRGTATS